MPDPAVSIIVYVSEPAAGAFGDTLNSAAEQSLGAEIIVVINRELFEGEVEAELLRRGSSIRHYVSESHATAGALLRLGVDASRGRHITWLKADDLLDPRKIEAQVNALGPDGSGCVSCDYRILGQIRSSSSLEFRQDRNATLNSLLVGTRNAATLLVSRDRLTEAGGFDPSFDDLAELDLAVRLGMRDSILHVPAPLMRRARPAPSPVSRPEFDRVVKRMMDCAADLGILDRLRDLGRIVAGLPIVSGALMERIQTRVAATVEESYLCLGVLPLPDGSSVRLESVLERLGVPNARTLALTAPAKPLDALAEALDKSSADWLALIDPAAPPRADVFALQVLKSASEDLDACLPAPDPLVYVSSLPILVSDGVLFRSSTLKRLPIPTIDSEAQFWAAFSREGRIEGLPPAASVKRPERGFAPKRDMLPFTNLKPADLVIALIDADWYAAVNPDIADLHEDPLDHFLKTGWREMRRPNPWFHTAWYLAKNPRVAARKINPLQHFVLEGATSGLDPSPCFDTAWYSKQYLDADLPCAEALLHFMTVGASMGYDPLSAARPFGGAKPNGGPSSVEPDAGMAVRVGGAEVDRGFGGCGMVLGYLCARSARFA
jgi:hypothetical protein